MLQSLSRGGGLGLLFAVALWTRGALLSLICALPPAAFTGLALYPGLGVLLLGAGLGLEQMRFLSCISSSWRAQDSVLGSQRLVLQCALPFSLL